MVEEIQMYLKSLNFGYRTTLREKGITYVNAYASFKEPNKLEVKKHPKNKQKCKL
jgi:thioredoxin reductase (NADPH)